jgi:V8-like Glu-specific endopeptidase
MDLGKSYRGTGFQVSPYCYLTAGHNVFWKDHWVDNITVVPAQYTGSDGSTTIKPYGEQLCPRQNLRSNDKFLQESSYINISEFDYGAILLAQPFAGINTFMPLEFHSPGQPLPDQVEIAGYPLYPYSNNRTSYNLWQAAGMVYNSPGGTYQQFIEFTAPVYGGNSGSPICYRNFLGQVRVVGITTWRYLDSAGGGGTLLTSQNEDLIRDWLAYTPTPDFKYTGYIPYFCSRDGCWTGLALANPNPDRCQAKVEYFAADGAPVGSQLLEIAAGGQAAFACSPNQNPYCTTGWIKISSTRPLSGLGLVGQNTPSTMFDMDLNTSLHQKLLFPHLAAEGEWRSTIILCNPNRESAGSLEFTCLQPDGTAVTKQSSVPAGGSLVLDLEELFRQPLNGGQLILTASQPIAAFLLYDNTGGATGSPNRLWRAGLSATPFE